MRVHGLEEIRACGIGPRRANEICTVGVTRPTRPSLLRSFVQLLAVLLGIWSAQTRKPKTWGTVHHIVVKRRTADGSRTRVQYQDVKSKTKECQYGICAIKSKVKDKHLQSTKYTVHCATLVWVYSRS